jgi:hypothetical protein
LDVVVRAQRRVRRYRSARCGRRLGRFGLCHELAVRAAVVPEGRSPVC